MRIRESPNMLTFLAMNQRKNKKVLFLPKPTLKIEALNIKNKKVFIN